MSPVAWIAILLIVAFFAYFGAKVVPAYFQYYALVDVVETVKNDPGLADASVEDIRAKLDKQMRLDDVDKLGKRAVSVVRKGPVVRIEIDYQVRKPFVGNIDLLMSFKRSSEL